MVLLTSQIVIAPLFWYFPVSYSFLEEEEQESLVRADDLYYFFVSEPVFEGHYPECINQLTTGVTAQVTDINIELKMVTQERVKLTDG